MQSMTMQQAEPRIVKVSQDRIELEAPYESDVVRYLEANSESTKQLLKEQADELRKGLPTSKGEGLAAILMLGLLVYVICLLFAGEDAIPSGFYVDPETVFSFALVAASMCGVGACASFALRQRFLSNHTLLRKQNLVRISIEKDDQMPLRELARGLVFETFDKKIPAYSPKGVEARTKIEQYILQAIEDVLNAPYSLAYIGNNPLQEQADQADLHVDYALRNIQRITDTYECEDSERKRALEPYMYHELPSSSI